MQIRKQTKRGLLQIDLQMFPENLLLLVLEKSPTRIEVLGVEKWLGKDSQAFANWGKPPTYKTQAK